MTFDREKILAEGGTYHSKKNPLIETAEFSPTVVMESVGRDLGIAEREGSAPESAKRMVVEGVFQRGGVKNANGRVYPTELWKNLLKEGGPVKKRIAERAMIGHLEHPTDGTTDLNRGAILVTNVWMENDGTVMGRAIVYNTPEGLRLQEYINTGTKVGISSRGTGTVNARGEVCEDFQLETWDMVYNPSTPGANPTIKLESTDSSNRAGTTVVETSERAGTISHQQVKPMSLSKRIAEVSETAVSLLATDPKKLTVEGRRKHADALLDLRVAIAEEFSGEKRVGDITKILESLDKAKASCTESEAAGGFTDAPVGATPGEGAGVPGRWGVLDAAIAKAGSDKAAAEQATAQLAQLIAANIGAAPAIASMVESFLAGNGNAVSESGSKDGKFHTVTTVQGEEGSELASKLSDMGADERKEWLEQFAHDHDYMEDEDTDASTEHPKTGLGVGYKSDEVTGPNGGRTYGVVWNPHHEHVHVFRHGGLDESEKSKATLGLLREARDELLRVTKREEAAHAIIESMRASARSLKVEMKGLALRESKATELIADLTSKAGKGEPKTAVTESVQESEKQTKLNNLVESVRKAQAKSDEAAHAETLPVSGKVEESASDAGEVGQEKIVESASKIDPGVAAFKAARKHLAESQGTPII